MSKTQLMTNEEVLTAAGVSASEIAAIKTADATTQVNTLEAIHKKLMSFVYAQTIEYANLSNPLTVFEKSYAEHNNGELNGMFEEVLVPTRAAGDDGLYAGKPYVPGAPVSPYTKVDFGADPLQYVYGINAKIERGINWDMDDFRMALNNEALGRYISAKKATLVQEDYGARYNIENNVINCEIFQYKPYATAEKFDDADSLDSWLHKVWTSQKYNKTNTQFKKTPFSTTRGISRLFFILKEDFWYDYAKNFQISNFLKPFMYRSEDRDNYGAQVTVEKSMVMVDELTPTTLAAGQILNPLSMTAATTIPAGYRLVGRVVDWNAVKFGIGVTPVMEKQLDPVTWFHDEVAQYCFDMCDAYINVPILVKDVFDGSRKFHIINDTPSA